MKTNTLYLFDINAIIQHNDINSTTNPFVIGFPEFLAKIGRDNIKILVPPNNIAQLPAIEARLAELNISDKIAVLHTDRDLEHYINHSYAANRYLFTYHFTIDEPHFKKPTALIVIDKNNDLLPPKNAVSVQNYKQISYLF